MVPQVLREAGTHVEIHGDHFADDCPDEHWIQEVTQRGWAILTKDKSIRRTRLEMQALRAAGAAAFFLTSGQMDAASMAEAFRVALPRMQKLFWTRTRPVLARVTMTGNVTVQEGVRAGGVKD